MSRGKQNKLYPKKIEVTFFVDRLTKQAIEKMAELSGLNYTEVLEDCLMRGASDILEELKIE